MPKSDVRSGEKTETVNTTEKWGSHASLEKYMEAVSAGAKMNQLTPDELVILTQRMIDALNEADAEKYQDALVAGFYGKTSAKLIHSERTNNVAGAVPRSLAKENFL